MDEIKQAEKDFVKGEYVPLEEVLKEEGFVLADKPRKKYEISSNLKKKGLFGQTAKWRFRRKIFASRLAL